MVVVVATNPVDVKKTLMWVVNADGWTNSRGTVKTIKKKDIKKDYLRAWVVAIHQQKYSWIKMA